MPDPLPLLEELNYPVRRDGLFAVLEAAQIETETVEHPPVFTVEESRSIKSALPGGHTKNLFLKDKKGRVLLISARDETAVPLKSLHKHIGCGRLSFGSADLLQELLGVAPGSVTAFALLNDRGGRVQFLLDAALMPFDRVYFHPLENTASTAIAPADLVRFAEITGHGAEIVDFAPLAHTSSG